MCALELSVCVRVYVYGSRVNIDVYWCVMCTGV